MLTKKITYTDYDGIERTETFYFNLSKAELAEMQLVHPGGYAEYLQRIVDAKDQEKVVEAFKTLILDAYGEKSDDGKRFRKSKELSENFSQTEAYSELFMELITNPDAGSAFVNGIMPASLLEESQKADLENRTRKRIEESKQDSAS